MADTLISVQEECPFSLPGEDYRIVRKLGEGGMGEVWEAEQISLERRVAIKFLSDKYCANEVMVRRFLREARICSKIHHDNITEILELGTTDDGQPYYVMEFIDGVPLSGYIADRDALEVLPALQLLVQISSALEEAHASEFVHRDLKPENVIVQRPRDEGKDARAVRCTVIDFGLARRVDLDPNASKLTRSGEIFGTPSYMPPEQIQGKPTDTRTDLYAFGCLAYELITGSPPFVAENLANLFYQHIFAEAPSLIDAIPEEHSRDERLIALDHLVKRTLEKDPENRPHATADVADALQYIVDGLGHGDRATAPQMSPGATDILSPYIPKEATPPRGEKRGLAWVVGASILLTGFIGYAVFSSAAPSATDTEAPESSIVPTGNESSVDEPPPVTRKVVIEDPDAQQATTIARPPDLVNVPATAPLEKEEPAKPKAKEASHKRTKPRRPKKTVKLSEEPEVPASKPEAHTPEPEPSTPKPETPAPKPEPPALLDPPQDDDELSPLRYE